MNIIIIIIIIIIMIIKVPLRSRELGEQGGVLQVWRAEAPPRASN